MATNETDPYALGRSAAETRRLTAALGRLEHALAQGAPVRTHGSVAASGRMSDGAKAKKKDARAHS